MMIFTALYLCRAKQLFIIGSESPYCSEHIWCGLTNSYTVKYEGPITFSTFYPKMNFSTPNIIWDILYIENFVVHLSSLHF